MDEKQLQKCISQVITRSLAMDYSKGNSKLAELQQFYQMKQLHFREQISEQGRSLTKKIFGTATRCIPSPEHTPSSPNLIALAYILLHIAFKDEYVLHLLIEELRKNGDHLAKMFSYFNPYRDVGIGAGDIKCIFVEILVKVNNWRGIFCMADIMRDYYVASEVYSLFLRMILVKVNYKDAENLQKSLQNSQEIYSILCDYFDLNVIAHRPTPKKPSTPSPSPKTSKPQVYLFSNYNLFISTADNLQFCCGRYYANESQLLACEKEIRKSTLEFIIKCKEDQEKEIREEDQERGDRLEIMGLSQMELDLGMSTSGMAFGGQGDTPYFNSNPETPEFGQLLDSARFRKSIDFQTALKMATKGENKLRTVEEEVQSPNSDGERNLQMKESHSKLFCKNKQLDQSLNFDSLGEEGSQNKAVIKIKVISNPSPTPKTEQQDSANKPRSPPSIESHQKEPTQQVTLKNWDNSRELTFHNNRESQNVSIETDQNRLQVLNFGTMISSPKEEANRLVIPVMGKKSLMENNSDMKSQSKMEYFEYDKEYKEFVNMSVKESQHFIKFEDNEMIKVNNNNSSNRNKRKDLNSRKYSANEAFTNEIKALKDRSRDVVHHSNHFNQPEIEPEIVDDGHMDRSRKTENYAIRRKEVNLVWENTRSDHLVIQHRESPRKMGFNSNVVDIHLASQEKDKEKGKTKRENVNQFKKEKIGFVSKLNLEELRKSKSRRDQKSPRLQKDLIEAVGLNRHMSAQQEGIGKKQKTKTEKFSNEKETELVSTMNIPRNNKKMSNEPRTSKFPQFLRNSKSRKGLVEAAVQPQNLITIQQKYSKTPQPNPQSQPQPLNIQHASIKLDKPLPNSPNQIPKQPNPKPQQPSPHHQTEQQLQQEQFQNRSKHTRSQPLLPNLVDSPHRNLLMFDAASIAREADGRPWQYFGLPGTKLGELRVQQEIRVNSVYNNQMTYLSRDSYSSNDNYQRRYYETVQPGLQFYNQTGSDRIRVDQGQMPTANFNDHRMYSSHSNFFHGQKAGGFSNRQPTYQQPTPYQQSYPYPFTNPQPQSHPIAHQQTLSPKASTQAQQLPPRQKFPLMSNSKVFAPQVESSTYQWNYYTQIKEQGQSGK